MAQFTKTQLYLEDPLYPPTAKQKLAYLQNPSQKTGFCVSWEKSSVPVLWPSGVPRAGAGQWACDVSKALFKNRGNTTSWAQKANYPTFYLGITLNTWTLVSYPCVHTKAQDCIEPRVFPVKAKFLP